MLKGKHVVAEIEGIRCTVVETGISEGRMQYLKELLLASGLEVKAEPEKSKEGTPTGNYVVGVTDLVFNPMIALYENKLVGRDGKVITPARWNQWPADLWEQPYWSFQH